MTIGADDLRRRLRGFGFADAAINAAWPRWWSDDANQSASARAELTFSIARKLGVEPASLLTFDGEPRFIWREEARFKRLRNEDERELAGITSFGRAVASALVAAAPDPQAELDSLPAAALRGQILAGGRPFVDLGDLLAVAWVMGVPVAHLRVFPWAQKRMAAMSLAVAGRAAILLAKDASYPPSIAFYLAHEMGHIALGHLREEEVIVDLDEEGQALAPLNEDDDEEMAADRYALELLTGHPEATVEATGAQANATRLAAAALESVAQNHVEPGVVALMYGYASGNWAIATGALKVLYANERAVWQEVNRVALSQLRLDQIPDDSVDYLETVMGVPAGNG